MKSTVITTQNAPLIAFRIKQFFKRYEATQNYSDWGWYPKYLNKMGVKSPFGNKHIERTITGYSIREITKVRIETDYGIIINIGKASADCFHLGYKIKIAPNKITISGYDKLMKRNFVSYYSPFSDIKKAKSQIDFNEEMDEQYWNEVELEHEEEIKLQLNN